MSKPTQEELKSKLTPLQFKVTQNDGTEAPFDNAYWDNKRQGIYVDVVSGEVLFSSLDKFKSGTGWPSFSRTVKSENIVEKTDRKLFSTRTEVRSRQADSHLGHVFPDGPGPSGQRYCINSAALRFVPVESLEAEGYGEHVVAFKQGSATELATLAGGCFWGVEELLRKLPGVLRTEVGYTGGEVVNATYRDVSKGTSGHAEAVQVTFDPKLTSYETILRYFFRLHDPTTVDQQGNDKGTQYRSAIFAHGDEQQKIAERVKQEIGASGAWSSPVVTRIVSAGEFYTAEVYHQDYLQKNPEGYTCHFVRD